MGNHDFKWNRWPVHPSIRIERGLPKKLIRRLVLWSLTGSGAYGCVHSIVVTKTAEPFRGWHAAGRVILRIGSSRVFPMKQQYPRRPTAPKYVLADWIEAFVALSAHEFFHAFDWSSNQNRGECAAERWAVKELKVFRKTRKSLGIDKPPSVTATKLVKASAARDDDKEKLAVKRDERMWSRINTKKSKKKLSKKKPKK